MYMTCGDIQGGWRKIADIQDGENCPPSWKSLTIPGPSRKVCRAGEDTAGVYSATYSTDANCTGFQHFCGKVVGIQKGSTDGFGNVGGKQIDDAYLDGVSITYGKPRKHLWSLAVGLSTSYNGQYKTNNCPCSQYSGTVPPSFVRDHYYCDSGSTQYPSHSTYYANNPVWDGEGCSSEYSCCAQAGMPYFYRKLPVPVNEDIEVRLSVNQAYADESVIIEIMELYVM